MRPRDVRVYLLDALAAAEQVVVIRSTIERERLLTDLIVRAAIERHFISIGEALNRAHEIEPPLVATIPHHRAIVGLRNRIVHGYFAIDWERIVIVVEQDLDPLVVKLRELTS